MTFSVHVLAVVINLLITTPVVQGDGAQTGDSSSGGGVGPLYSGGMYFDQVNELLYMTGINYNQALGGDDIMFGVGTVTETNSNCFVSIIDMSDDGNFQYFDEWKTHGSSSSVQTCTSVTVRNPSELIVVGSTQNSADISSFLDTTATTTTVDSSIPLLGMALVVDKTSLEWVSGLPLSTKEISPTTKLLYPISTVSDTSGNSIYIAALTSTDATQQQQDPFTNWEETQLYGSSFDMTVIKLQLSQSAEVDGVPSGQIVATETWTQEFPLTDPSARVYIGGLIYKRSTSNELVIVAGSTRGLGTGYGSATGDDEDGFITVLDPSTGELFSGITNTKREGSAEDDIVTGICDDTTDPTSFFIVGATRGGDVGTQQASSNMMGQVPAASLQPFIRKINVDNLGPVWTNQWAAVPGGTGSSTSPTFAYALDCAVSGSSVFVAGKVDAGASMVQTDTKLDSQGGDDIWVAKMDKLTGGVDWVVQLGSPGDDTVARYGGLVVNNQGDPMIYGDTTGSLYRQRATDGSDTATDTFVMSIDGTTGQIMDNDFLGGISTSGTSEIDTSPPDKTPAPTFAPVDTDNVPQPTYAPVTVRLPTAEHQFTAIGVQITGPAYAGGIAYRAESNSVILAGADFTQSKSSCFTGIVNLDNGNLESRNTQGTQGLSEACTSVAYDNPRAVGYAIGSMETGTSQYQSSSNWNATDSMVIAGTIMQLDDGLQLIGGNRITGYSVVYPIAVENDHNSDSFYVASMVSDESIGSPSSEEYPNYTTGGIRDFGTNYYLAVQRFSVNSFDGSPNTASVTESWSVNYRPTSGTLLVSGITLSGNGNSLVVTGSTQASGGPFETNDGDDMDGWILKLDPQNGQLYTGPDGSERSSSRLDSVNKMDDLILNVCNDRFDHDAFYVVGSTAGKVRTLPDDQQPPEGSVHAFVAKIGLKELGAEWLRHFTMSLPSGGVVTGEALACTVVPDTEGQNVVYVGGTVKDGALMDETSGSSQSNGGDDIFVAAMDGATGEINWIRQVGTPADDRLAPGRGLDVDAYGNVIVYGETTGSLYKANQGNNDMVVFTMNKVDGSYLNPQTNGEGVGDDTAHESGTTPPASDGGSLLDNIVASQSGPDIGPTYAGGMVYDPYSDAIYVTGATYGSFADPGSSQSSTSQCFFGIALLPKLEWKERSVFGTQNAPEACSAIALTNYLGNTEVIIVGSTEPGGLLTGLSTNTGGVQQYGMVLDLSNQGAGPYELLGGAVMDNTQVQFPIQVLAENEYVYMVSMASSDSAVVADYEKSTREYPNFTTGGIIKYGSQYSILVERHSITRSIQMNSDVMETTLSLDWRKPFETADQASVYVSGMTTIDSGEGLVVVGSTKSTSGDDMDGIMAKVKTADGGFDAESSEARPVAYFASVSGQNDWIMGVCSDPDDTNAFYIVGATEGNLDSSVNKADNSVREPVVAKIQTDSLSIVWSKQFGLVQGSATALGCAVVPGTGMIYVGGNLDTGAVIMNPSEPQQGLGGDDIFVANLETSSGNTVWLKQVGSDGHDRLANGGGIAADQYGNAVVYGDTTGELYRSRDGDRDGSFNDIFLAVYNQADGQHVPPLSSGAWVAPPSSSSMYSTPKYLAFAIAVLILLAGSIFCFCYSRQRQKKRLEAQQSSIFAYLQAFDVEDIDLRKSPPGGWHGTYLNKLAYGINQADTQSKLPDTFDQSINTSRSNGINGTPTNGSHDSTVEMAPLTHSSIVSDSLFMDTMSTPALGGQEYYDELSPRTYDEKRNSLRGNANIELI